MCVLVRLHSIFFLFYSPGNWKKYRILAVSCRGSKQSIAKLRGREWKNHRDERSLWKGMIAREDDHSLHLFNLLTGSISVSNLQRTTGDHSCVCTWMFFMTGRKATWKKKQKERVWKSDGRKDREGSVLYFRLFHIKVYKRTGRLIPSENSMCSTRY